jgi:hypothetical protein
MQTSDRRNPGWWNNQHDSAWERVKEALRRDWEQTKADLSKGGTDLNQDIGDTIGQAAGKKPIPAPNQPTPDDDWNQAEPAFRYGTGAREQYADENDWNERLEGKLREEWNDLRTGRTWDEVRGYVRHVWRSGREKHS